VADQPLHPEIADILDQLAHPPRRKQPVLDQITDALHDLTRLRLPDQTVRRLDEDTDLSLELVVRGGSPQLAFRTRHGGPS